MEKFEGAKTVLEWIKKYDLKLSSIKFNTGNNGKKIQLVRDETLDGIKLKKKVLATNKKVFLFSLKKRILKDIDFANESAFALYNFFKLYGYEEYFNDEDFRLFFIDVVANRNVNIVLSNLHYLKDGFKKSELNSKTSRKILDNLPALLNLYNYNGMIFQYVTIESVEFIHYCILDAFGSEDVIEAFGEDFNLVLNRLAFQGEVPKKFDTLFPYLTKVKKYYDVDSANENVVQNSSMVFSDLAVAEVHKDFSMDNEKTSKKAVSEKDYQFLHKKYEEYNLSSTYSSITEFYSVLKSFPFFEYLFGGFELLSNRLDSLNKHVYDDSFDIFKYLLENLELFNNIVMSLECLHDDVYLKKKDVDLSAVNLPVSEICSKIYLYSNIMKQKSVILERSYPTVILMNYVANEKKKALSMGDGSLNDENIFNGFVAYLDKPGNVCKGGKNGPYFVNFTNELPLYLMLCDDYFEASINKNFNILEFIANDLKVKDGYYASAFTEMLITDPFLHHLVPFDDKKIKQEDRDDVAASFKRFEFSQNVPFVSDLKNYMSGNFIDLIGDFSDFSSPESSKKIFDTMAVRYHSRISLNDFYSSVKSNHSPKDIIYGLKKMYRATDMDPIHAYIYFVYLENNIAHHTYESLPYIYLKEFDYYDDKLPVKKIGDLMNNYRNRSIDEVEKYIRETYSGEELSNKQKDFYQLLENSRGKILKRTFEDIIVSPRTSLPEKARIVACYEDAVENIKYYDLLKEKKESFSIKSKFVVEIIKRFYNTLFAYRRMCTPDSSSINDIRVSANDVSNIYHNLGYYIDIRQADDGGMVLFMNDFLFDRTHSVHLIESDFPIHICAGVDLTWDDIRSNLFEFSIYGSENNRADMQFNISYPYLYSVREKVFEEFDDCFASSHPNKFFKYEFVKLLADYYNVHPNMICRFLKDYNDAKLSKTLAEQAEFNTGAIIAS